MGGNLPSDCLHPHRPPNTKDAMKTKLLVAITSLMIAGSFTPALADEVSTLQDTVNSIDQQIKNDVTIGQNLPSAIEQASKVINDLASTYNVDLSTNVYGQLNTSVLEQSNIPSMIRGMIQDQINARATLQRSVTEIQNRIEQNTARLEQQRQALAYAIANPPAPEPTPASEPLASAQTDAQTQPVETTGGQAPEVSVVQPQTDPGTVPQASPGTDSGAVTTYLPDIIQPSTTTEGGTVGTQWIYECEGFTFDSRDSLVQFAKNNYSYFIVYKTATINEVGTDDDGDLFIDYSMESYDGEQEYMATYRDTFSVTSATMITYPTREIISIVTDGQSA